MKTIEIKVSTGYVGSEATADIEVDETLTDDEIHEEVIEYILSDMIDISWFEAKEDKE